MARVIVKILHTIWAVYAVLVFAVLAVTATLIVAVLPGLERRRLVAKRASQLIFLAWGIPVKVSGSELLPEHACVVVSNHASYLDGIILTAALPARFAFVIKKEMLSIPLAGLLLRRIGSEFVERKNQHRGAMDARRLLRKAHGGDALAFFPEGTFASEPGLRRFRSGAFVAAAKAGLPVVPVIIRGAREVLPNQHWLPRPGRLHVVVTEPVGPAGEKDNVAAQTLSSFSRRRILDLIDEPDLLDQEEAGRPAEKPVSAG